MIVADANVIAYLWLPGPYSSAAAGCFKRDPDWVAPALWRSEFRNILAHYLRKGLLDLPSAKRAMENAEDTLQRQEHAISSTEVLELVAKSSCSAYDCEYAALARRLGIKLVTKDAKILKEFPRDAIDLEAFIK